MLNSLPTLPVKLKGLSCNSNQLTTLPIFPSTLFNINVQSNQLINLPPLPDTLFTLFINDNPNLTCLPQLKTITYRFWYYNIGISCLPNNPNLGPGALANPVLGTYSICVPTTNPQITSPTTSLCGLSSITLSADSGTGYSYQWQLNGNNILGATSQSYNATVAGDYAVMVIYNCAIDTSNIITITGVTAPVVSVTASGSTSLCAGSTVTLNANTGTGLTYQWQLNGNNISGANSSSYVASNTGNYSVIVTNSCGSSTSNIISVNVNSAPSAAIGASGSTSFCNGGSVSLNANIGSGLTYQWQLDGNNISGATSSSYTATTSGNYSVIVSNNCGNSISNIISVTVASAPGSAGTIAGPTSFCRHSTQTFSVAPVAGATNYVWSVPSQATITYGSGTNSIVVNFKVKQGNVTVKPANQCGSGPLSVLPVEVIKCFNANNAVMREKSNSDNECHIFPNPASSEITIHFNSETENEFILNLYDIHGRIVLSENSKSIVGLNVLNVRIEFLNKGIYMAEIISGNERIIKKLIIN